MNSQIKRITYLYCHTCETNTDHIDIRCIPCRKMLRKKHAMLIINSDLENLVVYLEELLLPLQTSNHKATFIYNLLDKIYTNTERKVPTAFTFKIILLRLRDAACEEENSGILDLITELKDHCEESIESYKRKHVKNK